MSESGKYLLRKPGLLGPSQQIPSEHTSLLACFSACVDSSVYSCMCIYMLTRTRIYIISLYICVYIYMRIYMYILHKLIAYYIYIYMCVCVSVCGCFRYMYS